MPSGRGGDGRRPPRRLGLLDKTVRVWDLDSGACAAVLEGHEDPVLGVAVTADGRRAVSGSYDMTVRVWDLHDLPDGGETSGSGDLHQRQGAAHRRQRCREDRAGAAAGSQASRRPTRPTASGPRSSSWKRAGRSRREQTNPLDQGVDVGVGRHVGRDHPQRRTVAGVVAVQRAIDALVARRRVWTSWR